MEKMILSAHGSGGNMTMQLIEEVFLKYFDNKYLKEGNDSSIVEINSSKIAVTTDSFVINPIFFRNGDIGKLAVCGTVNDLVTSGAIPLYLTCGFIIEEGFLIEDLIKIVKSMADTAKDAGVVIVTGDTKVVEKGSCDKIFINTTGIGEYRDTLNISGKNAKLNDAIIITGNIGEHEASIIVERQELGLKSDVKSDVGFLSDVMESVYKVTKEIHVLRDPTRGGVATTLNEIAKSSNVVIELTEDSLPISQEVEGISSLLGFEPLYMANEGKFIIIVPNEVENLVLNELGKHVKTKDACIIGRVVDDKKGLLTMKTRTGGTRIVRPLEGEQLPRIC